MAISFPATPTAAAATTVTIPTHAAGDMLLIWAYQDGATTAITAPAAGGTVPTWVTIDAPTGANTCVGGLFWALATAANHTSGTWTSKTGLCAVSLRGVAPQPIGGHAQGNGTGLNTCLIPSLTMSCTSGSSLLLGFGGSRNVTAWGTTSGYTSQASVATEVAVVSKAVATSDGSVSMSPTNIASGSGYIAQHLEVLCENRVPIAVATYAAS